MLGEGSCYKVYTVEEGQCLQPPAEPGGNGVVFAGWHDWNDYAADFSLPIEEHRDYYAAWEKIWELQGIRQMCTVRIMAPDHDRQL